MKYQLLSLQKRPIFSTNDLALLWKMPKRSSLLVLIARYIKKGWLFAVRKGLYSKIPLDQIDPFLLGTAYVSDFSYVSTETILFDQGIINQRPRAITLVGKRSMEFSVAGQDYICRKLDAKYRLNKTGLSMINSDYYVASPERALADLQRYNSKCYIDNYQFINQADYQLIKKEVY